MVNKFSAAIRKPSSNSEPAAVSGKKSHDRPSRESTKHIGGYYDPAVSKQLRSIALDEDSSVQQLLAEAMDMLFHSRKKPTIAQK